MYKIMNFLNQDSENIKLNYAYIVLLLFSFYLLGSIFYDILQIHIYRHDSIYYMPSSDTYLKSKVAEEGRWLNYIFFNMVKLIPGSLLSIFILSSFLYFMFSVTYKWTKNYFYALTVALLFVQIPPSYDLITWPAISSAGFLVLLLSIFLQKKLNIFLYFILFGVLFFATMSNYYYLLPLLYLNFFHDHDWKQNLKFVSYKLIPAWAIGFVMGYIITQLIVYGMSEHFMQIANWRRPHYIHSFSDFMENVHRSVNALKGGIRSIFFNDWLIVLFIFSIVVSSMGRKKDLVFIPLFLFVAILLIHYIIVLPVGIAISPRTIVATWVGVFAIAFLIPKIKNWQVYLLVPIIVFFTSRLYLENHDNLQWYANVTNLHYHKLKSELPKPVSEYKGVILYATDKEIRERNNYISTIHGTPKKQNIEGQGAFMRWSPAAWESGANSVINCNNKESRNALWYSVKDIKAICQNVSKAVDNYKVNDDTKFFNIVGEYDERIIVSFNKHWNGK